MPDLRGAGVLVTRPAGQSASLVDAIGAAGGRAVEFPALAVSALPEAEIEAAAGGLAAPDITLFVSPNAVRHGLRHAAGKIGAIGPGTVAALRASGRDVDIDPGSGYDSEHLLATKVLKSLNGRRVRIVRGQSGRELLASTLRHRGADVDYLSVYRRTVPARTDEEVNGLIERWRNGDIRVVTIMSSETLANFIEIIGRDGVELARRTPLVTPAARVIQKAEAELPGVLAVLADGTSADALVEAVDSVLPND